MTVPNDWITALCVMAVDEMKGGMGVGIPGSASDTGEGGVNAGEWFRGPDLAGDWAACR